MHFTVDLTLPPEVERLLSRDIRGLSREAGEALAVQLFRRGKLNHFQLSEALGIDHIETDAVLRRYNVDENSLSTGDFEADRATLRDVLRKPVE